MGLGPITAAVNGSGSGEGVWHVQGCLMRWNLLLIFYIISMNFRFEFDVVFLGSPSSLIALVNNTRESLWKWAQEVSIKRLINV